MAEQKGQPQRQKSTGQKVKDVLFGAKNKAFDKSAGKLSKEGKQTKKKVKKKAEKGAQDAEELANRQLELAAGLGEDEVEAFEATRREMDEGMRLRTQQLGAARLQNDRARGNATLITDLEQDLAFQDQAQQAALAAASGGGLFGRSMAAHSAAAGAGDTARTFATARSQEVGSAEGSLLGSLGSIKQGDIAAARIASSIEIAQMQNVVERQSELHSAASRRELGFAEDLHRLQQAELDADNALKVAEFSRPKQKGILGGLMGIVGAGVGSMGGPAGSAALGAAAGGVGNAISGAVNR